MKKDTNIFSLEAKSIVDGFFNNKLFKDYITRDDMNEVEKFIGDMMQMRYECQLRGEALIRSLDKDKNKK